MDAIFSPLLIDCISSDETAIEKWVGLTRRIAAIERQYCYDDATLVRHVYDLNAIKKADRIKDTFYDLAEIIINSDAKQFKNQHPEYFNNPAAEIYQSLQILKNKPVWKERYQQFTDSMVYEKITMPAYDSAIQTLEEISTGIIEKLNQSR